MLCVPLRYACVVPLLLTLLESCKLACKANAWHKETPGSPGATGGRPSIALLAGQGACRSCALHYSCCCCRCEPAVAVGGGLLHLLLCCCLGLQVGSRGRGGAPSPPAAAAAPTAGVLPAIISRLEPPFSFFTCSSTCVPQWLQPPQADGHCCAAEGSACTASCQQTTGMNKLQEAVSEHNPEQAAQPSRNRAVADWFRQCSKHIQHLHHSTTHLLAAAGAGGTTTADTGATN